MTKIKWRCCCSILLLFFSVPSFTQVNISGRVVDAADDKPLPAASVYFNNTTTGTYTNQHGDFNFDAVNLISTEIVVYCPGYEIAAFKPGTEQVRGKKLVFKLQAKDANEEKPLHLSDTVRNMWLSIFYENFFGISEEAEKTTVSNEQQIYFTNGNSSTSFRAWADTPLVIVNKLLGYKIIFNLTEFLYEGTTDESYFTGFAKFEEIGDAKKYVKNRKRCYDGSSMHFYRSVIADQLYEQNFNTFLIPSTENITEPGNDKQRAVPVSAQQILYIDSTNNFAIKPNGRLLVQYTKDPYSKPFFLQQIFAGEGMLQKGVESFITFKIPAIGLNKEDVLHDPSAVEYKGYWTYEKVANRLPYNYQPE